MVLEVRYDLVMLTDVQDETVLINTFFANASIEADLDFITSFLQQGTSGTQVTYSSYKSKAKYSCSLGTTSCGSLGILKTAAMWYNELFDDGALLYWYFTPFE